MKEMIKERLDEIDTYKAFSEIIIALAVVFSITMF